MKYVEAAGLVKFDFLGLKTLTVIEKCCAVVRHRTGGDFRIHNIPLDDHATFALLGRVETVGIFQLESAGMRDVLRKLQPDRFEDLIALVALYRPGPMDDIPRYLACKHGQEEVTYLHPSLEPILAPTYGVMVYQEQVMEIAQTLGGYTMGAADLLRRAMGKKIKAEMDAQRALFTQGAIQNGVTPEIANQIFDQMAKFAGYGFNKSHSAPYALLAYQTAYLKANYPQEFFAATMTYDLNNTDKLNAYRQDMQRMGLPLLPPDITRSHAAFAVEGDGVRYGLAAIKNVGEQAMEAMAKERAQNGGFPTLKDFAARMDPRQVNKRQMENLIAAGAFDTLHTNRHELVENSDEILSYAGATQGDKAQKQNMLFSQEASGVSRPFTLKPCDEWNTLERLQKEFEALGFYLSAHPLDVYQDILPSLDVVPTFEIGDKLSSGQGAMNLAGIVLAKQERTAKSGQKFAFITLSDRWGVCEVTLFSEMLNKARDYIVPGKALYISVSGRSDGETYRLTAQSIEELASKTHGKGLSLVMADDVDLPRFLKLLETIPEGNSLITLTLQLKGHPSATLKLGKTFTLSPDQRLELMHVKGMRTLN
jgi:DNA polymerase-3 subunit alpha